jgi:predicted AAA+ superfamily ATPase
MGCPDRTEGNLAELAAHEQLRREHERFGFLTSAKGGEVDFYCHKKWAIEVKWSESITNLSKAYKDLRILNKKIWNQENFLS